MVNCAELALTWIMPAKTSSSPTTRCHAMAAGKRQKPSGAAITGGSGLPAGPMLLAVVVLVLVALTITLRHFLKHLEILF